MYEPESGSLTTTQLLTARDEFQRRVDTGEQDVRVVVAQHVPTVSWETTEVDFRGNGCRVDVLYSADLAFVDVELVDANEGLPHHAAVVEVTGQLYCYSRLLPNREFRVAGERIIFTNASGRRVAREPDSGLCPDASVLQVPETPRLVIEVSVKHLSLATAQARYQEYFNIPTVRAVVLIKLFGYRPTTGTAAALAVLYRLDDADNVVVDDVVSFGTAAIDHQVVPVMAKIAETRRASPNEQYRDLSGPNANISPNANVNPNARAEITIPATDLYFGTNLVGADGAMLQPRPNLAIDLREIFQQYIRRF